MKRIKYFAAAFALLFALSANMAPAMASSHDKDKSDKYEQQDKNKSDKNKAGDKRGKKMDDEGDKDDDGKGMRDSESKSEKKKWWEF